MPVAIEVLEKDPFADGDFFRGDLLLNVLRNVSWLVERPSLMGRIAAIVQLVVKLEFMDEDRGDKYEVIEIREIVEAFVSEHLDERAK